MAAIPMNGINSRLVAPANGATNSGKVNGHTAKRPYVPMNNGPKPKKRKLDRETVLPVGAPMRVHHPLLVGSSAPRSPMLNSTAPRSPLLRPSPLPSRGFGHPAPFPAAMLPHTPLHAAPKGGVPQTGFVAQALGQPAGRAQVPKIHAYNVLKKGMIAIELDFQMIRMPSPPPSDLTNDLPWLDPRYQRLSWDSLDPTCPVPHLESKPKRKARPTKKPPPTKDNKDHPKRTKPAMHQRRGIKPDDKLPSPPKPNSAKPSPAKPSPAKPAKPSPNKSASPNKPAKPSPNKASKPSSNKAASKPFPNKSTRPAPAKATRAIPTKAVTSIPRRQSPKPRRLSPKPARASKALSTRTGPKPEKPASPAKEPKEAPSLGKPQVAPAHPSSPKKRPTPTPEKAGPRPSPPRATQARAQGIKKSKSTAPGSPKKSRGQHTKPSQLPVKRTKNAKEAKRTQSPDKRPLMSKRPTASSLKPAKKAPRQSPPPSPETLPLAASKAASTSALPKSKTSPSLAPQDSPSPIPSAKRVFKPRNPRKKHGKRKKEPVPPDPSPAKKKPRVEEGNDLPPVESVRDITRADLMDVSPENWLNSLLDDDVEGERELKYVHLS